MSHQKCFVLEGFFFLSCASFLSFFFRRWESSGECKWPFRWFLTSNLGLLEMQLIHVALDCSFRRNWLVHLSIGWRTCCHCLQGPSLPLNLSGNRCESQTFWLQCVSATCFPVKWESWILTNAKQKKCYSCKQVPSLDSWTSEAIIPRDFARNTGARDSIADLSSKTFSKLLLYF